MYEKGWGVEPDASKAIQLYENAAESGEFMAFIFLARIYAEGKGVEKDSNKAANYYREAVKYELKVDAVEEISEAKKYLS